VIRRLLLGGVLLAGACAPRTGRVDPAAAGDSLRGRVAVVGSEPATSAALTMDGGPGVTLAGLSRAAAERLAGLEVVVWGAAEEPRSFRVSRFAVRAANGVAAVDGVLLRESGRDLLLTADGRRLAVPHLPAALAGRTGARIWLAGPLDRSPDSFGVIEEPRP
jgi:hypothetical protein